MSDGEHIVIVGAGHAGGSLAARLRSNGFAGRITMFGDEPQLPYQRPPLSKKYLSGEWPEERLMLRTAGFWRDHGIEVVVGSPVTAIDPVDKTLTTSGQTTGWTKLALTTGAEPRPLPEGFADKRGVHVMRTIGDVDRMRPEFREGGSLLIVGGGYIGLEAAAVGVMAGLAVTVVERAPRILERVACAQTSEFIRALHTSHGARIMEGRQIVRTVGGAAIEAVELDNGERIDCDLAVVGIGVAPRTALAAAAGIACDNGILVDAYGRTSAPDIWAAGDCASFQYEGQLTRLESVQNAVDQAERVADNMMGSEVPYAPVPWFWSDQYDVKLQIAGLCRGHDAVVRRDGEKSASIWYFRGGRLIAVDAMNDARAFMAARRIFEAGRTVSRGEVEAPDFDPIRLARG